MSAKLKLLCALASAVGAASGFGCQTYDFEPVEPLAIAQTTQSRTVHAKKSKPNMMLLVDKSGSMNFAADPTISGCETCGASQCSGSCPRTRMADLRAAMQSFLTGPGGTVARMGLLPYPANAACGAATIQPFPATGVELNQSATDADSELQATAQAINQKIQAEIIPGGGTPTGASLSALAGYDKLLGDERDDFVLLLTDGAPNCNPNLDRVTCACTTTKQADNTCPSPSANQCLDKDGVVAAVTMLRSKGIRTIVVGFGAEAAASTGGAADVLSAAAEAGGFSRTCPKGTDDECGGGAGSCIQATKVCTTKYYKAADGAALIKALVDIGTLVGVGDPCEFKLDASPSDPRFLTVIIDGVSTAASDSTWSLSAGNVTFLGALCTKLSNATPSTEVKVEFRIVEGL